MKAALHTLGCKTNAYETQAVREQLESAGWQIGVFSEPCDVYIINTCSVTAEAARKSRQMIGRCKRLNPKALVVVTGCYAQETGSRLLAETKADMVVGNGEKSRILPMISQWIEHHREDPLTSSCDTVCIRDLSRCRTYETQTITGQADHVRVYVKIQDGCDRFCSYCLIPFLRGRSRSRNMQDIYRETASLAAAGCREIVLTGIDISSYASPSEKEGEPDLDLGDLIVQLDCIAGIERIRLGSLEAGIVSTELLEKLHRAASFCPQFHLSLQSGSDGVLRRMNRHYSTREYQEAVKLIRTYYPDAGITTDIIVGFPGETEAEFEETLDFVQQIQFSRVHVFPYSRRKGTRADQMEGQLSHAVKDARTRTLIAAAAESRKTYESRFMGKPCPVLVEECIQLPEEGGKILLNGYTPEYVRITAEAGNNPEKARKYLGQIVNLVPDAVSGDGLHGSLLLASIEKLG